MPSRRPRCTLEHSPAHHKTMNGPTSRPVPLDQADGLRRLFAHARVRFVPVVSNPHMAFGGVMLERLCAAFGEHGKHTLVIDAGERAPLPSEMALMELAECIETLSTQVSYLGARGLPARGGARGAPPRAPPRSATGARTTRARRQPAQNKTTAKKKKETKHPPRQPPPPRKLHPKQAPPTRAPQTVPKRARTPRAP